MKSDAKVECQECPFAMYCKATLFTLGFLLGMTVFQSIARISVHSLIHHKPRSVAMDTNTQCGSSDVLCEALG